MRQFYFSILVPLILGLVACSPPASPPRATLTATLLPGMCNLGNTGTRVPCASIQPTPTPAPKIDVPLVTVTGIVTNLGTSADGKAVRLVLKPDAPTMKSDLTISDWSRVNTYFYWEGFQTPVPVSKPNANTLVAQNALNHRVTIGYYATEPPTLVMVSIHKQKGDPQK